MGPKLVYIFLGSVFQLSLVASIYTFIYINYFIYVLSIILSFLFFIISLVIVGNTSYIFTRNYDIENNSPRRLLGFSYGNIIFWVMAIIIFLAIKS